MKIIFICGPSYFRKSTVELQLKTSKVTFVNLYLIERQGVNDKRQKERIT